MQKLKAPGVFNPKEGYIALIKSFMILFQFLQSFLTFRGFTSFHLKNNTFTKNLKILRL